MSAHQYTNKAPAEQPAKPLPVKFMTFQEIVRAIAELQANAITSIIGDGNNTATVSQGEATVGIAAGGLPPGGTNAQVLTRKNVNGYEWRTA